MAESLAFSDQVLNLDEQTTDQNQQLNDLGIPGAPPDNQGMDQGQAPEQVDTPQEDPNAKRKQVLQSLKTATFSGDKYAQSSWLNPKVVPYQDVRKYMDMPYGYTYGLDNDDFYGQQEGVFTSTGKGLARLGFGIFTKVGQGAGFLLGLANPTNWDENLIDNAASNGFTQLFDQLDEKTKNDWLPTFQEAEDRQKGFWNKLATDGDFWMTDAVDGLAFLVSAWVPGMALSKLGLGMKAARALSATRLGIGAAETAVEGAAAAQNYLTKASSLAKGIDKFNAWGLATAGEAMFEATSVRDNVMKSLSEDEFGRVKVNPETGLPYTEEQKREVAGGAAQNTFLMNSILLAGTNSIELKWFSSLMNAGEGSAVRSLVGGLGLTDNLAAKEATTLLGRFFNNTGAGAFIKGMPGGIISEGFVEENAQLAIQRVNETYGAKGKILGFQDVGKFLSQYGNQTIAALSGKDQEAAESIGLGGMLGVLGGGAAAVSQYKADQNFTTQVVQAYNLAQENWMKFGNIYKTREVVTTDEKGNQVKNQQVILDQNNKPIIDADKLSGVLTGYGAVNGAFTESQALEPGFKRDLLRDTAFAQFVLAHIDAGMEDALLEKLDGVRKAKPEELIKLGFVLGPNAEQEINRYKNLASAIISQNKLINSDILQDGTKEDKGRKNYLTQLAAEQAVYKSLMGQQQSSVDEVKNQIINSDNTSLTDGLVDQLNDLAQRIKSQEEVIKEMGTDPASSTRAKLAKQVLDDLKQNYEQLEKNNETSIKELKKDKNGVYQYEKSQRNQPGLTQQYNKRARLKGELQNHVQSLGLEWAQYADTIDGKKNFMTMFQQDIIDPLIKQSQEAAQQNNQTQSAAGKTITLTGVDEKGNNKSIDITEGKLYVGKLSKSKKFRGKQIVSVFNNDKIKIVSISEDGQTVSIAVNGEVLELTAQELADIAITEKWVSYDSLTPDQKLYISLRNFEIQYRVLERDASGKPVKGANGKYKTRVVKGRVTLNKAKTDLLFSYIDPTNGKRRFVDFNMKYVENKQSLEKLLSPEQAAVAAQEAKLKKKFDTQQQYLANLINQTEASLADSQARRDSNDKEFAKLEKELKDLKEMMEEAVAYLEKNPYTRGRKSNAYKAMEQLSEELSTEISKKEQQLAMLKKEQEELKTLLESLKLVNEQYYEGLIELEQTGSPFLADKSGSLFAEQEQQLQTAEQNQITTRFNSDQLGTMIADTEAEVDLIDERVNILQKHIENLRELLKKVLVFKDVADALMNVTDRQQLRNVLKLLEDQSTVIPENKEVLDINGVLVPAGALERGTIQGIDSVKAELIKALRKGLASGKGIEAQYTLELMERYKEAIREIDDLIVRRDELAPKLIRLQTALEQKQLVSSLQERIEFLKIIQEGLLAEYKIENAEIIAQRQAKAAEVIQNQLSGNKSADEEATNDGDTFKYDTKKPLLSVTGLFTTSGRHFVDDEDTELNMENNNAMFFKFSSAVNLLDDEFFLMPVTAENDQFGIRREDMYVDDIKFVVVKKVGNEYKYVDVNGEVLENPTKDTLIYTSMQGNAIMLGDNLQAAIDDVKKKYTTKGLTDAEVLDHIKRFKAFRETIKDDLKEGRPTYIPVTGKSKGIQVYLPKDANNLPQELPLDGRLVDQDTMDYNNMSHPDGQPVKLLVATTKDNTALEVNPGRTVIQKSDGTTFRVFNRQMSQEEKDNFVNVLKVFTGLMGRKNSTTSPLTRQEALDLDDIITYLNGLVFWTKPESGFTSANRFYIDTTKGMIYRGDTAIAFTSDAIEAAKDQLTAGLYHQVNNNLLKINSPFYQVVVDSNGRILKNEYQNYTHYLLGTQDMAGKQRALGTPVVYTNTPTYSIDDLTPQLKSVYLTYQDPANPIVPKVMVPQNNFVFPGPQAQPNTQPQIATAATGFVFNPNAGVQTQQPAAQQAPVANTQQNPFVFNPNAAVQQQPAAVATAVPGVNPFVFNPNPVAQQPATTAAPVGNPFVFNPTAAAAPQTTAQAPANPFAFNPANPQPVQPIFPTPQSAAPGQPNIVSTILSGQYQASMPGNIVDPKLQNLYRLALDKMTKREDFGKVANWFSKKLPQIPIQKVAQLIDGIAWGAFKNGSVYLYENAEEGTGFHEAFEAVWNSYLSDEQQQELAKAFRSLPGEFTNKFTEETKPYSQASMYDVREMLAEGFRDYMLERDTFGGRILKFFQELLNAIKSLVGLGKEINEAEELINDVYKSINKGKFVQAEPVRDVNALGTVYSRAIPDTTQEFSSLINEGLTGFFFMNLYADQKNIDSLIDKYANTHNLLKELYVKSLEDLKNYLMGPASEFGQQYVAVYQNQIGRPLDSAELEQLWAYYVSQSRLAKQIHAAFAYPKEVYDNLKASLRKFGLDFKELTDEELEQYEQSKEDTTTDGLGIRDAIFIDPRRLTAVNFRLLIGSLTQDVYNQQAKSDTNPMGIVFQKNSIGLPKLVDFDSVHSMLINELNGSASRIENGRFVDALSEMMNKLDQKYKKADGTYKEGYVWIERLKRRLKYAGQPGSYFSTANVTSDDIALMIGFEKSLMNKQNLPVKTIINEDGYIYDTDPIESSNVDKIREEWENNVMKSTQPLSRKSPNELLGVDDKGMIVIDRNSYVYAGNPANGAEVYVSMARPTFNQVVEILGQLGIKFSASNEELKKHKVLINQAFSSIREKIADGTINTMQDLFGSNIVNKAISDLVRIQTDFVSEDNVLMHYTADGKPQYSITLPSNITYVLNSLNASKNLADFVRSNPQFGTVDANGNVALHPYQQRSMLLKQGGLIFDENGNKRSNADLTYHLISGVANNESDGTNTSDLTYPDRVMQEIHYLLKHKDNKAAPIHYTIINSDKSTEFGIGMSQAFVSFRDASAPIGSPTFQPVMDIYLAQLEDELDAAIREKEVPSNIQYYSKQVKNLGHYREILGEKLVKEFNDRVLNGKMTKQAFINKPAVKQAIEKHIAELVEETLQGLIDLDIIEATEIGETSSGKPVYEYSTKAISNENLKQFKLDGSQMNQADVESLVSYLALNKEIAVAEQHKLIYGHPVMYKDLAKRANAANSTKDAVVDNHEIIKWMDQNMPRLDGKNRSENVIQTFKNITYQDVTAVSQYYKEIAEGLYASMKEDMKKDDVEKRIGVRFDSKGKFKNFILDDKKLTGEIKAYVELNEADGQGWIMPDMYRDMLYLSSKFSKQQLRQWEYEKAYEIIARVSKRKDHPAYKNYFDIYTKEQMREFREIAEGPNPGAVMNVLKPQYFGYASNASVMQTVFLKHSVQPKFYRQVEGTQFENLYVAAQNSQVDVIGVESGEKVGSMLDANGEFLPVYNKAGEINVKISYNDNGQLERTSLPDGLPVQELFTRYYGIQQEVPSMSKDKVVRGTQVTKLVMSNFYENGKPISAKAGELIKEYNDVLEKMVRKGKAELLEELGMQQLSDGSYVITDVNKTINLVRAELEKRDLPSNLIDALQPSTDNENPVYKFDTLANSKKIDNILNSIVDSRVISEKMFGKAAVQVASTGFESQGRKMAYLNDKGVYEEVVDQDVSDKKVIPVSNDLSFYRNSAGRIESMEVYVTWFFDNINPEDLGFIFKNGVYEIPAGFDQRLLQAIGFRIPTQGMNSIESIKIKGFLPKEMGDTVVVPSEIVGKSGSDFDIDKLNIYLSNYVAVYSKFTPEEIGLFKESPFYANIPRAARATLATMDAAQFADLIDDLNNFSVTSGKGKFGNLSEYIKTNNIPFDTAYAFTEAKKALVDYNQYRYEARERNKEGSRQKPIIESIQYVESNGETKMSLQNRFKEIMQDLVTLPENYRQLTTPNSATTLKTLATEISELKGKDDAENSMAALRKFIPMAEIRQRYLAGKAMVGIAALQTTSHTMSQVSSIRLTGTYDPKSLYYLFEGTRKKEIIVRLPHNKNENGELYLYAKKDQSGRWISELLSEALTGFVDAAKDPFVFELNLSLGTAGTWFYLQKLGVPVQDIGYLFNQPIVDSYMKEDAKNRSYFKKANGDNMSKFMLMLKAAQPFMDAVPQLKGTYETVVNNLDLIDKYEDPTAFPNMDYQTKKQLVIGLRKEIKSIRQKVAAQLDQIRDDSKTLSTDQLRDAIKNHYSKGYKITEADAKFQLGMLLDYFEHSAQGQFLTEFIRSIGYDNTKTKTIIENELQSSRWTKMQTSEFIANPDSILENTFLGEMKKQKEDLGNLFSKFFVSLHPKAQAAFEPIRRQINNPDVFMSADGQSQLINKYQNFFINYVIQTTQFMKNGVQTALNTQYEALMKGPMSIGKQLKFLREITDPNISENPFVKELLPILTSDTSQVDNIKLFKNRMDTYKNDVLIEGISNLQTYAQATGNQALQKFVEDLSIFAILQSGFQDGSLNYTKVLPVHLYTKLVNGILTNFTDGQAQINPQLVWRQFHQNFWKNANMTPRVKFAKKDKLTGNLKISTSFSDGQFDYVTKVTIRPDLAGRANEQKRAEMIKQKRSSEVFETVLYEKIQDEVDMGDDLISIYRPIGKLGDGYKFMEVYAEDRQSILPQNHTVDPTTGQIQATYIPTDKLAVVAMGSAILPAQPQNQIGSMPSQFILANPVAQPATPIAGVLGSIKLNIIEDWVQTGQATTTVRSDRYHNSFYKGDGNYSTDEGNIVSITYRGLVQLQGNNIIGNGFTLTKDQFAAAEGFGNWTNFDQQAQYAGRTLVNGQAVHFYDIKPTGQQVNVSQGLTKVKKIISGGQTGVDKAGLEVGKELSFQTGGTAAPGFAIENGTDQSLKDFGVQEISSVIQSGKTGKDFWLPRTEQNVVNSDGTVYFATDADSAGKIATERFAKTHNKPFLLNPTADQLRQWLNANNIQTLNVAGNRGSKLTNEQRENIKNILRGALGQASSAATQTDDQIRNSSAYKTWLAKNANPIMTEQQNFEYYKQCKS